jgi:HAD superfamily hydrolase (TIGR01484 family)
MHFIALATDYDETLANEGKVTPETLAALERFKRSGRKLVMVTGRELPDLQSVFERLDLFDRVIAENGALLYRPDSRESVELGDPPPPEFIERLHRADIPLSVGSSMPSAISASSCRSSSTRAR